MFLYLSSALCPVQFWPLTGFTDSTWMFALNWARAQHLVIGRDVFWTWGPLSYLVFPMNVAGTFWPAVAFQTVTWLFLLGVLFDLLYRSDLPLRNLMIFSVLLGLSATVCGPDQALLRCALILLVQYQLGLGKRRYVAALAILGFLPLIKFTWLLFTFGAAMGLVLYPFLSRRPGAWRDVVLAFVIPLCVTAIGLWLTLGSFHAIAAYMKVSVELSSGYNLAMSTRGASTEFLAAFEVMILVVIVWAAMAARDRNISIFLGLFLAAPLLVSFKHGFVRQDIHIDYYFCFVAVVLGLAALIAPLNKKRVAITFAIVTLVFTLLWQDNVARIDPRLALMSTGLATPYKLWQVLKHRTGQESLRADVQETLPPVEPEILALVQHEPIASLSVSYTNLYAAGGNLVLYPVIQRYSAYTPYLDELNAAWVRDKGPRFLIFDGNSIDGRHPWTETPAMWLEVYRWYDTRLLGAHNLLLERRPAPRFSALAPLGRSRLLQGEELRLPTSSQPVFWSLNCALSGVGKLRVFLFRVREVKMTVNQKEPNENFRVVLAVMAAPSPGSILPSSLPGFARLFHDSEDINPSVEELRFGGPGMKAYERECSVEFLRPVR